MAKPTYYPDWATTDVNLPGTGKANKVRPKEVIRTVGWDKGQIPTAEEANWWFNNTGLWIRYFDQEFIPTVAQTYLPKNGTKITFSGDLAGTATFAGNAAITANISVLDNSHEHLSDNISDATHLATPNTIVKRTANATIAAGDIISCATSATDAATYFLQDLNGRTIGNISSTQGDGGGLSISRITPSTQAVANQIVLTASAGTQISHPRSLNAQETVGTALVRYDYLTSRLNTMQNEINAVETSVQTNSISQIRLGTRQVYEERRNTERMAGGVMTAWADYGDSNYWVSLRPLQYRINNTWYTVAYT